MNYNAIFLLTVTSLLLVSRSDADFFEFMSQAMRFMGRVMGMDPVPEARAEADPGRTAERIRALHDAAKFVSEARQRAGKRVLRNKMERMRSSMSAGGIDVPESSDAETTSTDDAGGGSLSSALSDDAGSSLDSLLSDADSGTDSTTATDLESLLKARSASQRRNLNALVAKLLATKLKQRQKSDLLRRLG